MLYILSHPRLTKSANPLANKLSELTGKEIRVFTSTLNHIQGELIIRYGNSQGNPFKDTNYNHPQMIRLAGNKLRLSEILQEKEFSHVNYFTTGNPGQYPVVVRNELNRGGGIGISICENENEFKKLQHWGAWSFWYNFQFELGVHILGGEIKRVFKKIRKDGLEEEKYPIRNTQRGYDFSLRENWKENYSGLDKFVAKLYEIVPIQFARLDVGFDKNTGGYRLIEINSAPDLSQNKNTLDMYAKFLSEKIGG